MFSDDDVYTEPELTGSDYSYYSDTETESDNDTQFSDINLGDYEICILYSKLVDYCRETYCPVLDNIDIVKFKKILQSGTRL